MPKRVLITGVSGFAGSHLAEYLVSLGKYSISGTYLSEQSLGNIKAVAHNLQLFHIDLQDKNGVSTIVKKVKPDLIFHLAALPGVGDSFGNPGASIVNNILVQVNLLEAVRVHSLTNCRILVVSSADVYGKISEKDLPIDENTKFYPTNSYAVSKIAQDYSALQYYISYGLSIVRARPFNHVGPRQAPGFVIADWAKGIATIEKGGKTPVLSVGNLDIKRDFTDVRDMVRAYALLVEKGKAGDVYNIGSDIAYKILDILDILLSFSKVKIIVKVAATLLRPEDSPQRLCDSSKMRKLTGWKPTVPIEKTLKDTLDYWRGIV